MRSVPCVRSWRSLNHLAFDDGYLVYPLAFCHKKGVLVEFLLSGGDFLFLVGACGVFRLYLGASLCT